MSVHATLTRRPAPLPAELTPMLGREHEANRLHELLDDPSIRLVTVIGPGGVGKTRLALHVASSLIDDYDEAVAYIPLAAITDPALVLPAIAQAFGVFADIQDAPEDQIAEILGDQLALLVLDNLEQVLAVAPALTRVLGRCPRVTMLVTSQAPLNVAGEQLFPLSPLPLPSIDVTSTGEILATDAVALFVQRARAVNPNLVLDDDTAQTIAGICRRLDGLPLAIELAAARSNILSPNALLARLSNRLQVLGGGRTDVPDRLRTMRSAVSWSHDLLSTDEQALFRQMAVFSGGFSLDAVESIFQPADASADALDVLSALADHSLIQPDPLQTADARFLMLETLRDFGLERLEQFDEDAQARLAHATWVVELAEAAHPHLTGRGQEEWVRRLEPDTKNIRAAAEWSLANGHDEIALRIGGAIWRFCSTHGLAADCRGWLERALHDPATGEPAHRTRALIGIGNLFEDVRALGAARGAFEQARNLAAATGNLVDESQAYLGLGTIAHDTGDYAAAFDLHARAAELARESGNQHCIARATGNLGTVSYFRGNLEDAARHWEEARSILAGLGDTVTEAIVTSNLGALAYDMGEFQRSEQLQQRALELQRHMHSTRDIPYTLANLGEVLTILGDHAQAQDCFTEAIELLRQEGDSVVEGIALNGFAGLALAQGEIALAATRVMASTRLVAQADDQRSLVENGDTLARICSTSGDHTTAAELLGATSNQRALLGMDLTPHKMREQWQIEETARSALRDARYTTAWEIGQRLDIAAMTERITAVSSQIAGQHRPAAETAVDTPQPEPAAPPARHNLTRRELEVLRLLAEGRSTQEISDTLFITPRTTGTHITNILGKLGVTSRTAAVALALREGLV